MNPAQTQFDTGIWLTWGLAHALAIPAGLLAGQWADSILAYLLFAGVVSLAQAIVIQSLAPDEQKQVRMVNWGVASFIGWGGGLLLAEIGQRVGETAVPLILEFPRTGLVLGILSSIAFQFLVHWRVRYHTPVFFITLMLVGWVAGQVSTMIMVIDHGTLTQTILQLILGGMVLGLLTGLPIAFFSIDEKKT